jgi:recombination protein RecR
LYRAKDEKIKDNVIRKSAIMEYTPAPLLNAAEQFAKLPGIGMKTAQRLAYHILSLPVEAAEEFAEGILAARKSVKFCNICQNFTTESADVCPPAAEIICSLCGNSQRNHKVICVVETPKDVAVFERAGVFSGKTGSTCGVYHVLHGLLSPMDAPKTFVFVSLWSGSAAILMRL